MTIVIRDYVAPGEKLNAEEKERNKRAFQPGNVVLDYIPDPDAPVIPPVDREASEDRALQAAIAAGERAEDSIREQANKLLKDTSVPEAVDRIEGLSPWEQEVWVDEEKKGKARRGILERFKFGRKD